MELNEKQKRWVEALRSKKYKQGKHYLASSEKGEEKNYCCLGVACEVFKEELGLKQTYAYSNADKVDYVEYDGSYGVLNNKVKDYLNLKGDDGAFLNENGNYVEMDVDNLSKPSSLSELNDSTDYSFEKIADVIEQNASLIFCKNETV